MPTSPSLRCSPVTELRKGSYCTRGHSLDSGLLLKAKDDDLVLFTEMQKHEMGNFLLHMPADFDDTILKARCIADSKLGISIPALRGSSDLLQIDADKNEYDWLLTPPETPLFPSLDDEPQLVITSRGRTRNQPIPISKQLVNKKTQRTSRCSASPNRLSLPPQSSYGVIQPAARPSSAPRSSPSPVNPQTTPLQIPSSPLTKPSTPTPRSSTPTFQRMSTGTGGQAFSSSRKGTSPTKAKRGPSTSPKFRGWKSNLPGFSINAPSNIQTSPSDRSASHVRGSSPASKNSMHSSSKSGMPLISPSASRSAGWSHSHERHKFASCSKASASSGDDDVDLVLPSGVGVSGSSAVKNYGAFENGRTMSYGKKNSRLPSASSGRRSSLDSMDHQENPQHMFKRLIPTLPATTSYVVKTNSVHGTMFSKNLSHTSNGNESSKSGLNVARDIDDSDHGQSDLAGDRRKIKDAETQEEVFIFDEFDEKSEDTRCGKCILIMAMDGCKDVWQECAVISELLDSRKQGATNPDKTLEETGKELSDTPGRKVHLQMRVTEIPEKNSSKLILGEHERSSKQEVDFFPDNSPPQLVRDVGEEHHLSEQVTDILLNTGDQQILEQLKESLDEESATEATGPQKSNLIADPSPTFDSPVGTGISVLLMQTSSSSKWPVVQGRAFSARRTFSEPSYVRDNLSGMNCNIEPNVIVEAPRRSTQRTFTLEEATYTILFCSSIVHDLAYKAATIGMDKEMALMETSCPTTKHLAKSVSNQKYFGDISHKRIQNPRKFKRKRQEIGTKKQPEDLGNNDKKPEFVSSNAVVPQTGDSMKPPKLESKCNCTVM